jgi:plastocyanin
MWKMLLGALALALFAFGCGDSSSSNSTTNGAAQGPPVSLPGTVQDHGTKDIGTATTVAVEMDDTYFDPTFIKAKPGATVTVNLSNEGQMPHTFTIDDHGVDQEVDPGKKATVTVTMPPSGDLVFYCRFHRDSGMQGAFSVSTTSGASSSNTTPATPATTMPATTGAAGGGYGY